jgi:hypothetical protein
MAGSRYTLELEVVTKGMDKQLGKAGAAVDKLSDKLEDLGKAKGGDDQSVLDRTRMWGHQLEDSAARWEARGRQISAFGKNMLGGIRNLTQGVIMEASMFETAEANLKFSFGDKWEKMYQRTQDEAAKLSFTFGETLRLVGDLGKLKIDPFGGDRAAKSMNVFKGKTGEMVSALQVIQDTADASGKRAGDAMYAIREAMAGQWMSLRSRFNIPSEWLKEWKKEMKGATTQQEKYNVLIDKLAEKFGGAGELRKFDWSKIMENLPDLIQIIKGTAGRKGLRHMAMGLQGIIDALLRISKNKKFMAALSGTFEMMGVVIGGVLKYIGKFIEFVGKLVGQHPYLIMVALAFVVITGTVFSLTGAMMILGAAAMGVVAAFMVIGIKVTAVMIALLPLVITFGVWLALIPLFLFAIASAFNRVGEKAGSTTVSLFEKLKVVFDVIVEIFRTYEKGVVAFSQATEDAIHKTGIEGWVQNLIAFADNLRSFWGGLVEGWDILSDELGPHVMILFTQLKLLIFDVMEALGMTTKGEEGMISWADAGRGLIRIFTEMTKIFIQVVLWTVVFTRAMINSGTAKVILYTILMLFIAISVVLLILGVIAAVVLLAIAGFMLMMLGPIYLAYKAGLALRDVLISLGAIDPPLRKAQSSFDGFIAKTHAAEAAVKKLQKANDGLGKGGMPIRMGTSVLEQQRTGPQIGPDGRQRYPGSVAPGGVRMGVPGTPPPLPGGHVHPPDAGRGGSQQGDGGQEKVVSSLAVVEDLLAKLNSTFSKKKMSVHVSMDSTEVAAIVQEKNDQTGGVQ